MPKAPEAERKSCEVRASTSSRISRAELIERVLAKDVLECPRCHGRVKIIATVTDPEAVRKVLMCIGLPARSSPIAPAREREQAELGFER